MMRIKTKLLTSYERHISKLLNDNTLKPVFARKCWVYVIACQRPNHYYVGITRNPYYRIKQHESGDGSYFTKLHGFKHVVGLWETQNTIIAQQLENALARWLLLAGPAFIIAGGCAGAHGKPGYYAQVSWFGTGFGCYHGACLLAFYLTRITC